MKQAKMKNLYLAKCMEDLQKKAELDERSINKTTLDKLCKSARKLLDEGESMYKECDEECAFVYLFKSVSLILHLEKLAGSSVNGELLKNIKSLKKLAAPALDKAEKLKQSLIKRYAALQEANKIKCDEESSLSSAHTESNDKDKLLKQVDNQVNWHAITDEKRAIFPDFSRKDDISCDDFYAMLDNTSVKLLLIDVRPTQEFERENIPNSNCINIPEEILKPGVSESDIESYLSKSALCKWKERNSADFVILMDYCTDDIKKIPFSHPLRVMKDLISKISKTKPLKSSPKILKGGYAEWLLTHPFTAVTRKTGQTKKASIIDLDVDYMDYSDTSSNTYPDLEFLTLFDNNSKREKEHENSTNRMLLNNWINDSDSENALINAPPINRHTKPGQVARSCIDSSPTDENNMSSNQISTLGMISDHTYSTFSVVEPTPEVDRRLKPAWSQNLDVTTGREIITALNREDNFLNDSLRLAQEQLNKEREFEQLRLRKELEAEESKRIELQRQEIILLESILTLSKKSSLLESQYKITKEENRAMKKMLEEKGVVESDWINDIAAKESQKASMDEEVEKLRKQRKLKELETNKRKKASTGFEKDDKDSTSFKEPNGRAKFPSEKDYTAPLKSFRSTNASSGLTRSYSSPNIAQMVAEEAAEARKIQPAVDRSLKPKLERSFNMKREISSVRIRNLNPVYGNAAVRGIAGLRNLGNTCYMNAIIQCLSNTEEIASYFQSDNYRQHLKKNNKQGSNGEVAEEFAVIIKALWAWQYKNFYPKDFKNTASKYIPMCRGRDQQDSHEFLLVLIDILHGDLNQGYDNKVPLQNSDSLSDKEAAENFWNHHQTKHRSLISETVEGLLKSSLFCCICGHTSNSYEIISCVSLPISSSKSSLKDCLTAFMKPERMFGEAAWYCPSCKEKREAEKHLSFWRLPNVLIIQLKRFSYEGLWRSKIQVFVDFPFELEMNDYTGMKTKQYKLYGVVNHSGSLEGGHYIAYCKNQCNGKWYEYDDSEVTEVNASKIVTSAAYLLFYTL